MLYIDQEDKQKNFISQYSQHVKQSSNSKFLKNSKTPLKFDRMTNNAGIRQYSAYKPKPQNSIFDTKSLNNSNSNTMNLDDESIASSHQQVTKANSFKKTFGLQFVAENASDAYSR